MSNPFQGWTAADVERHNAKINENRSEVSSPIMERSSGDALPNSRKDEARHSGRLAVVVTSFRRRLLDEDNLAIKWHLDALRYAGILRDDSPAEISVKACQQKVKTKDEERTEILIDEIG